MNSLASTPVPVSRRLRPLWQVLFILLVAAGVSHGQEIKIKRIPRTNTFHAADLLIVDSWLGSGSNYSTRSLSASNIIPGLSLLTSNNLATLQSSNLNSQAWSTVSTNSYVRSTNGTARGLTIADATASRVAAFDANGKLTNAPAGTAGQLLTSTGSGFGFSNAPSGPWTDNGTFIIPSGTVASQSAPIMIRRDGSVFYGTNQFQDVNVNDFGNFRPLYALSMVSSNEPKEIDLQLTVIDNESTFSFFSYDTQYVYNDGTTGYSYITLDVGTTNGHEDAVLIACDPNNGSYIKIRENRNDGKGAVVRAALFPSDEDPYIWDTDTYRTSGAIEYTRNYGTNIFQVLFDGTTLARGSSVATNGFASFATNSTVPIVSTGITNTLSVNYRLFGLTGTSVVQTNRSVGFSRGTIVTPTDIVLQPGEFVKGTSISVQGSQAF